MLQTTAEDLVSSFSSVKNLNAALKTLLKREGRNNATLETFAKSFRSAAASPLPDAMQSFVAQQYPRKEIHFLAALQIAHREFIEREIEKVFTTYADRFNATYEKTGDSITVKDERTFNTIVKEVSDLFDQDLKTAGLPTNNFMKNALLASVFDAEVLREVVKVLG